MCGPDGLVKPAMLTRCRCLPEMCISCNFEPTSHSHMGLPFWSRTTSMSTKNFKFASSQKKLQDVCSICGRVRHGTSMTVTSNLAGWALLKQPCWRHSTVSNFMAAYWRGRYWQDRSQMDRRWHVVSLCVKFSAIILRHCDRKRQFTHVQLDSVLTRPTTQTDVRNCNVVKDV